MTRIAIIGSGNIGASLARRWSAKGHELTLGSRDPSKPGVVALAAETGARVSGLEDAVSTGDVVVFAIPWAAMEETVAGIGAMLEGRIVIDATNNIRQEPANSAGVILGAAPGAQYFRAFNSYGWELIERPVVGGTQADAFYCGPDGAARAVVEQLIEDVGLHPIRVGGPEQVGVVDGVLRLWIALTMGQGHNRHMALKLLEE